LPVLVSTTAVVAVGDIFNCDWLVIS
jgi:hypothetical protein